MGRRTIPEVNFYICDGCNAEVQHDGTTFGPLRWGILKVIVRGVDRSWEEIVPGKCKKVDESEPKTSLTEYTLCPTCISEAASAVGDWIKKASSNVGVHKKAVDEPED